MLAFCDAETSRLKAWSAVMPSRCIKIPLAIPMVSRDESALRNSACRAEPVSAIAACAANNSPMTSELTSNAFRFEEYRPSVPRVRSLVKSAYPSID